MVQEGRTLLINSLKRFFSEKGYREAEPMEDLDLVFAGYSKTIGVKLLFYTSNPAKDQKAARGYIYRLLREKPCDEIYFAVEEVRYSHLPRFEEFKESGIGLLRVHEDRVEIAVPARPFEQLNTTPVAQRKPLASGHSSLASGTLLPEEVLIKEIERRVVELVEQRLAEYLGGRAPATHPLVKGPEEHSLADRFEKLREASIQSHAEAIDLQGSALPDIEFLKGNPWLGVLMKRGVE